jgi:hypothetical protein
LLLLLVLSKADCKILILVRQIQNFEILDLMMAKVKQVNIAVTSITQKTQHNNTQPYVTPSNYSQLKEHIV